MSASCSIGTFHGLCKSLAMDLETFLGSLGADHEITNEDVTYYHQETKKSLGLTI